jgi:hypothetical protein
MDPPSLEMERCRRLSAVAGTPEGIGYDRRHAFRARTRHHRSVILARTFVARTSLAISFRAPIEPNAAVMISILLFWPQPSEE